MPVRHPSFFLVLRLVLRMRLRPSRAALFIFQVPIVRAASPWAMASPPACRLFDVGPVSNMATALAGARRRLGTGSAGLQSP
jgi:hypothetical protein